MDWKQLISDKRFGKESAHRVATEQRTEFQRDYDRLIFSSPFRRMQNKTQVFPLPGSIFVHNRLTHSLEVSSVGRSLGTDVTRNLLRKHTGLEERDVASIGSIVSAACLAHDLGNPPFGHSGERAIRSYFAEGRGKELRTYTTDDGQRLTDAEWADITRFDGNANTFRLLTHQFGGRRRGGYVMTYSTLAAIVKYPFSSRLATSKPKFGFFDSEADYFALIARELGMPLEETPDGFRSVRHPLVYLVEAADDICYEIMDIEDAYKLRILTYEEASHLYLNFFNGPDREALLRAYPDATDESDRLAYLRSCVINALERACVEVFITNEEAILEGTFRGSLIDSLPEPLARAYRECEEVAVRKIYFCREVVDVDLAGHRIIDTLLDLMIEAIKAPDRAYSHLLLAQVSTQYQLSSPKFSERLMAVLDYLSGMTDVYALNLYRKINGHSLPGV
jgi:dGTPase